HFGIRTDRYKLIRFYEFDEWEFYDLQNDPKEMTNQYGNPEYKDTIADLKNQLTDLRKSYKDDTDISVKPLEWQKQFRPE
ncbi:MAG: DUF4976 domain-containing protein, partial [Planctomycetaceae bacterium]|nr:DUF4976 domain-containing protein [Planctomycetaceae bacterium]